MYIYNNHFLQYIRQLSYLGFRNCYRSFSDTCFHSSFLYIMIFFSTHWFQWPCNKMAFFLISNLLHITNATTLLFCWQENVVINLCVQMFHCKAFFLDSDVFCKYIQNARWNVLKRRFPRSRSVFIFLIIKIKQRCENEKLPKAWRKRLIHSDLFV